MTTAPATEAATATPAAPARLDERSRRAVLLDVAVVCAVAVLPDVYRALRWALAAPDDPATRSPGFVAFASSTIVRSLPAIVVTLYVISRSGRPWGEFGFRPFRVLVDPLIAVGAVAAAYAAYYGLWYATALAAPRFLAAAVQAQPAFRFATPAGGVQWGLLVVMAIVNGFAEELVMRGFLIRQLERLLRSAWVAIVLTAAVFAAYHAYQGIAGVINGVAMSAVFGILFVVTRRLWPLAVAHTMMDLLGYVLLANR